MKKWCPQHEKKGLPASESPKRKRAEQSGFEFYGPRAPIDQLYAVRGSLLGQFFATQVALSWTIFFLFIPGSGGVANPRSYLTAEIYFRFRTRFRAFVQIRKSIALRVKNFTRNRWKVNQSGDLRRRPQDESSLSGNFTGARPSTRVPGVGKRRARLVENPFTSYQRAASRGR